MMRYELSDYEWTAIKPMLPNKPRGIRRVKTVACSMAPFGFCVRVRRSATCQTYGLRAKLQLLRSAGVWNQIMDALACWRLPKL